VVGPNIQMNAFEGRLMLMELHINGDDDVQAYSKAIRAWLEADDGRPTVQRHAIADPIGSPSLR
jgi:hypothetical protein